jgi:phenylacetate-CoA ligase
VLRLAATTPRTQLVDELNAFRPDALSGYASVIALLAADQLDGRRQIAPTIVTTSSEPRAPGTTDRIRAAWATEPYDLYATTETGPAALDCSHHTGRHVFEDLTIIEVVDDHDRPVPDGTTGHHLLLTNLFNHTQPIIRYRAQDLASYEPGTCACGRPFRRLRAIEGRTDDILELPTPAAGTVQLHATTFSALFATEGVAELEIIQRDTELRVSFVARDGVDAGVLGATLARETRQLLARHGARTDTIDVRATPTLERDPNAGKIKLIRHEPR